ncbi:hypothetical protein [Flavobacterium okayamense]|uniref:Uncharacterized protein n=1 Tax=Flavobacterium okayamense TaxID=2830782 RepID=A0ABM7S5V9_9FLAO|nr:hypothetical protein [Flavobacterium okayamense]BCY28945.1 hypothetical protein KK2020170_18130 [Flavobacterium okayamense]
MKTIKSALHYFIWILLSLVVGIIYMRLLLGSPSKINYKGFDYLIGIYYYHGLVFVGTIIGIFIAVFFFIIDYFILRKKLSNNWNSLLIRISILLLIAIIVGIVHYILEKVIDVI